jgi:hypothetical protein
MGASRFGIRGADTALHQSFTIRLFRTELGTLESNHLKRGFF